jgi:hypothetical protein
MNDNTEKCLPVQYPLNTTWTFHANLMAIISNYDSTLEWILSNYIQIYCKEDQRKPGNLFVDFSMLPNLFKQCPWVKTQDFDRQTINLFHKDIMSFFIESINDGNYLYGIFDEYKFRDKTFNGKFLHELFVFGYNLKSKLFNIADFTLIYTGRYSFGTMPFEKVTNAFMNVEPHEDYLQDDKTALTLIKFNKYANYSFDSLLVKNQLTDYLNSIEDFTYRTCANHIKGTVYGISVYECLQSYLETFISKEMEIDFKPFHFLYIHKLYMVNRIIYMKKNGWLTFCFNDLDDWLYLKDALLLLRLKCLKYNQNKKDKTFLDIKNTLYEIKSKEFSLTERLIKKIVI